MIEPAVIFGLLIYGTFSGEILEIDEDSRFKRFYEVASLN